MKFFIVTPSFNQLDWLKLCIASVADQVGHDKTDPDMPNSFPKASPLIVHHHIQDGGSNDGTKEFLAEHASEIDDYIQKRGLTNYFFSFNSCPDKGMYDAVNRGWTGADRDTDVFAYLNCDEQYLPNTLKIVNQYFSLHSKADFVFGDALITRPDGTLISFRKAYTARWQYISASHLYLLSCTLFFRRRIIDDNYLFNSALKTISDADFVIRILKNAYQPAHIRNFLSTFTFTGKNLSTKEIALKERIGAAQQRAWHLRCLDPLFNISRLVEKALSGAYFARKPIKYSVFTYSDVLKRKQFIAEKASFLWPS
jgi:glycosyltransferase involved in cell wall biosynthesis